MRGYPVLPPPRRPSAATPAPERKTGTPVGLVVRWVADASVSATALVVAGSAVGAEPGKPHGAPGRPPRQPRAGGVGGCAGLGAPPTAPPPRRGHTPPPPPPTPPRP